MRHAIQLSPAALLLVCAVGCSCGDGSGTSECTTSSDCGASAACIDGACVGVSADGGLDGSSDATVDAGPACDGVPCAERCCGAGDACRQGACFPERPCMSQDDCIGDAYCDADGLCTPYGAPPEHTRDPGCTRPPQRPDRFLATEQCSFIAAPAGDPAPSYVEAHSTPIVIDLDLDSDPTTRHPSIVWAASDGSSGACAAGRPVLRVIDGETCASEFALTRDDQRVGGGPVAAGDLDGDGRPEIVAVAIDGGLIAFRYDAMSGTLDTLWRSADRTPPGQSCTGPSLADLDDDGTPEVLFAGLVYAADGTLLTAEPGRLPVYSFADAFGVAADVDLDGLPELVTSGGTYAWDPGPPARWALEPYFTATPGTAGWVAVADFGDFPGRAGDAPGRPEVVVAGLGEIRVQSIGGDVVAGPFALRDPAHRGGPPTIADFDGDGAPEFATADGAGYSVYELTGELWSRGSQDASSGVTGSSVFDFEGDGRAEVIYADECYVRVYDGQSSQVIYSEGRTSCTWVENPIVADVDGDFHSEIVVPMDVACSITCPAVDPEFTGLRCGADADCPAGATCSGGLCTCTADDQCGDRHACRGGTCKAISLPRRAGIEVLRDARDRWAPSRAIWNQHAYFVTNTAEDGTIPRSAAAARNWETPGLNDFRQNVQGSFSPLASPDLTVGDGEFGRDCSEAAPDLSLTARVCNRGTDGAAAGVRVVFTTEADPASPVCEAATSRPLAPGECARVSCTWSGVPLRTPTDLLVRVDPDDAVAECHEGNGDALIPGAQCPPPLM